jgi:hypothetical protein
MTNVTTLEASFALAAASTGEAYPTADLIEDALVPFDAAMTAIDTRRRPPGQAAPRTERITRCGRLHPSGNFLD